MIALSWVHSLLHKIPGRFTPRRQHIARNAARPSSSSVGHSTLSPPWQLAPDGPEKDAIRTDVIRRVSSSGRNRLQSGGFINSLTVRPSTKLNRSHLVTGHTALILRSLGRTDKDLRAGRKQLVTV